MEEETATTEEDKMDVFIALWNHQQMLWDPSDPTASAKIKEGIQIV